MTCGEVQRGHSLFCLRVRFEADSSQLEDWMFRFFVLSYSSLSNSVSSPVLPAFWRPLVKLPSRL